MADVFDYFKWRGDLSIETAPLNEVDNMIFSRLSYIPFEDIVSCEFNKTITIKKAGAKFLECENPEKKVLFAGDMKLITEIYKSKRFNEMELCGYINNIDDESQMQFCGMTIRIKKKLYYTVFRGTDDTFVGWKENFNMSFVSAVPSQIYAVEYLTRAMKYLKGDFIVGGHSKGGNLAVYSSAYIDIKYQKRIISVYNNDGPGFDDVVLKTNGYKNISSKIKTFVPQSSVIGMLLGHAEKHQIVHSTESGIKQHDTYSWEVEKDRFVAFDTASNSSVFIDKTIKEWLQEVDVAQREQFFEAIYSIIKSSNTATYKEFGANWYNNAKAVLKSIKNLDEPTRQVISKAINVLFLSAKKNFVFKVQSPVGFLKKVTNSKKNIE